MVFRQTTTVYYLTIGLRPMQRIFSGIQPSGIPTLGNYLGAIRNWVDLQKDHECLWCVVDLHAITVFQDPKALTAATREMAATLLACGVDPANHTLFLQSSVRAHAQLAWIFNCVARLGWLNRMTQFKDKAGKDRETASAGLYVYPNLMAADIHAYHATRVPVGDDQKQHLELANDIAQKFNHDYGVEFFPTIEPLILGPAARVMSLRDGTRKMSNQKSSPMFQLGEDGPLSGKRTNPARSGFLSSPAWTRSAWATPRSSYTACKSRLRSRATCTADSGLSGRVSRSLTRASTRSSSGVPSRQCTRAIVGPSRSLT